MSLTIIVITNCFVTFLNIFRKINLQRSTGLQGSKFNTVTVRILLLRQKIKQYFTKLLKKKIITAIQHIRSKSRQNELQKEFFE